MGKITDGVRKFATKMGNSRPRWPKRKPTEAEKKQLDRWEGEGGAVPDDDADHG